MPPRLKKRYREETDVSTSSSSSLYALTPPTRELQQLIQNKAFVYARTCPSDRLLEIFKLGRTSRDHPYFRLADCLTESPHEYYVFCFTVENDDLSRELEAELLHQCLPYRIKDPVTKRLTEKVQLAEAMLFRIATACYEKVMQEHALTIQEDQECEFFQFLLFSILGHHYGEDVEETVFLPWVELTELATIACQAHPPLPSITSRDRFQNRMSFLKWDPNAADGFTCCPKQIADTYLLTHVPARTFMEAVMILASRLKIPFRSYATPAEAFFCRFQSQASSSSSSVRTTSQFWHHEGETGEENTPNENTKKGGDEVTQVLIHAAQLISTQVVNMEDENEAQRRFFMAEDHFKEKEGLSANYNACMKKCGFRNHTGYFLSLFDIEKSLRQAMKDPTFSICTELLQKRLSTLSRADVLFAFLAEKMQAKLYKTADAEKDLTGKARMQKKRRFRSMKLYDSFHQKYPTFQYVTTRSQFGAYMRQRGFKKCRFSQNGRRQYMYEFSVEDLLGLFKQKSMRETARPL